VPDADLLERFLRQRDEAAFELLVWRHGKMVLGTCRRLLHDAHEAEDAFQACFVALARRGGALRGAAAAGGWADKGASRPAPGAEGGGGRGRGGEAARGRGRRPRTAAGRPRAGGGRAGPGRGGGRP